MNIYLLWMGLALIGLIEARMVHIIPIFDSGIEFLERDGARDLVFRPFYDLKVDLEKSGYSVIVSTDLSKSEDALAVISFGRFEPRILVQLSKIAREKCFLFCFEPIVIQPQCYDGLLLSHFGKIFIMSDDLVDNISYFKFYYPQPQLHMVDNVSAFEEKKMSVMIAGNHSSSHPDVLYGTRKNVIEFYAGLPKGDFDLYGNRWDGYRDWQGPCPHKWPILCKYKFSYCYENMTNQRGYITEKIFDCMVGGCVPIYLGATNITDYIPKECFIDRRDFDSDGELYSYLRNMNKAHYENYIDAIKKYLAGPQAYLYSIENFVQIIKDNLALLEAFA